MPSEKLDNLLEKCVKRGVEIGALINSGAATPDDLKEAGELRKERERLNLQLAARADMAIVTAAPKSDDEPVPRTTGRVQRADTKKKVHGFASMGDLARSVASARMSGNADERLAQYVNQNQAVRSGEEGGYLVPDDLSPDFKDLHGGASSIVSLCDTRPTSSSHVMVPVEDGVPHDFDGGVVAYWVSELTAGTKTRLSLQEQAMTLHKCVALVEASNESLSDAPAVDQLLRIKMPQAITARTNQALMRGTGAGQPIGVIDAPATVVAAREVGQNAATIEFKNIANMYALLDPKLIPGARWMVTPQAMPQILGLTVNVQNVAGAENVGGSAAFMPAGSVVGAPAGSLLGIPIMPSEWCKPLGTQGDIMLVGWSMYNCRVRTGEEGTAGQIMMSTHVSFDLDASMFRLTTRVAGFPWWAKPKPAADSGNPDTSMIVALGAPAT